MKLSTTFLLFLTLLSSPYLQFHSAWSGINGLSIMGVSAQTPVQDPNAVYNSAIQQLNALLAVTTDNNARITIIGQITALQNAQVSQVSVTHWYYFLARSGHSALPRSKSPMSRK
jgi:hypothetical protein